MQRGQKGFTLIEILIVIGLIAILSAIVLIAVNPSRQFAQARNSQRTSDVTAILNAMEQNIADNKGIWTCSGQPLPSSPTDAKTGGFDIRACLVPTYISEMPVDPTKGSSWNGSSYDADYLVSQVGTTSRIMISAPDAELSETISITR